MKNISGFITQNMCLICDCEFGTKSEAVSHVKENHLDVISQSETPLTHQEDFNSTLESPIVSCTKLN